MCKVILHVCGILYRLLLHTTTAESMCGCMCPCVYLTVLTSKGNEPVMNVLFFISSCLGITVLHFCVALCEFFHTDFHQIKHPDIKTCKRSHLGAGFRKDCRSTTDVSVGFGPAPATSVFCLATLHRKHTHTHKSSEVQEEYCCAL